jgi:putative MATE family efflux protein
LALDQDFVINRKTIFKMLIPVLIDQLFITLLPIINTVVVSKLGSSSMSSVAIVDQINQLVSMAAVAIAMGAAVVVAQYTGRGDRHGVTHTICQSYSSSLVLTLMIMVLVLIFSNGIINMALSGATEEMKTIAKTYLYVTAFSYPFYCFYANTTQILRGVGHPREAMYTSIAMNTSIFLINALMIYGLKKGVVGAGIATLCGRAVGAIVGAFMVIRSGFAKKVSDFFTLKFDLHTQGVMMRMGVPTGMQNFAFMCARLVMNVFILPFGTDHYAANVVFTQMLDLQCVGSTVVAGMAPAIMGIAKGRGDQEGIKSAFKDLNFISFWLGAACSFIPIPFLKQINVLYHMSPISAGIANKMILGNVIYIIALVWFAQAAPAAFRGIGDSVIPPVIMIAGVWCGRVLTLAALTTWFKMGTYALYWALIADYALRSVLYFWRYKSGAWLRAQKGVD